METPRIEEMVGQYAEMLDSVQEKYEFQRMSTPQREETEHYLTNALTEAHQAGDKDGYERGRLAGIDEAVERVMPFLKAYKQSLDCDWSVNPVQATNLVYRLPEAVLRDQADAIEAKRKMLKDLDDTIKALQDKK